MHYYLVWMLKNVSFVVINYLLFLNFTFNGAYKISTDLSCYKYKYIVYFYQLTYTTMIFFIKAASKNFLLRMRLAFAL